MKHILTFSGGKDSIAMLFKCLEQPNKYPIDEILFFDTGYEFDEMYEFLDRVDSKLKFFGLKITRIGNGRQTWKKWSTGLFTRGKYKNRMRGFPVTLGMSWCTRELKIVPGEKYLKKYDNYIKYVGIASDEKKRIKKDKNIIYPLVEMNMTEEDCLKYIKEIGLYNKLYDDFKRTGCYLCPKQNQKSLKILIEKYPEKWEEIKRMKEFFLKNNSPFALFGIHGTKYFEDKLRGKNND